MGAIKPTPDTWQAPRLYLHLFQPRELWEERRENEITIFFFLKTAAVFDESETCALEFIV